MSAAALARLQSEQVNSIIPQTDSQSDAGPGLPTGCLADRFQTASLAQTSGASAAGLPFEPLRAARAGAS